MTLPRRTPSKPEEPVLPWPLSTRPSGCSPAPRCVRPPWFSKPASTRGGPSLVEAHLDRDVADQPRAVGRADRLEVDEAEAGDLVVAELVAVAEQLKAAADAEHDRAARRRRVQRVALGLDEVQRAQALVAVLAAAEVEEVVGVGVDRVAEAGGRHARSRSRATRSGARACSRLPRSA